MKEEKTPKELLKERHETGKKREKAVLTFSIMVLILGYAMLLMGLLTQTFYQDLRQFDHLTDDGIAVKNLDNATYTWSDTELHEMASNQLYVMVIGGATIAVGITALLVTGVLGTSEIKTHKIQCDGSGDKEYCPECGLKLSRLEKD